MCVHNIRVSQLYDNHFNTIAYAVQVSKQNQQLVYKYNLQSYEKAVKREREGLEINKSKLKQKLERGETGASVMTTTCWLYINNGHSSCSSSVLLTH